MARSTFKKKDLEQESIFHKFFRVPKKSNAAIEINNLLASKGIEKVKPDEIIEIYTKYKLKSSKQIQAHLEELYKSYLEFCLKDKKLSKEELNCLKLLKKLFDFSDNDLKSIEEDTIIKVYGESLSEFLKDNKLSSEEKKKIEQLKKDIILDDKIAKEICGKKVQEIYNRYLNEAISDARLSPQEEKQLKAIAENLHITDIKADEATKKQLEKYQLFWSIENGNIPSVEHEINLQKNEKCYFVKDVELHELRRITKRINYGGPTFRVKIMKGLYYRVGSLAVRPVSEDIMTRIDSGKLYLTNKRLIFNGSKKNTTIRLNKIIDFEGFRNGVSIDKDSGKSPFYTFSEDIDLFCVTLGALLKNI